MESHTMFTEEVVSAEPEVRPALSEGTKHRPSLSPHAHLRTERAMHAWLIASGGQTILKIQNHHMFPCAAPKLVARAVANSCPN